MAKAIKNSNNSKISINAEQKFYGESILPEVERYQLLVEWNKTESNYPIDKCIHQLFEEQVKRSPDAIAVVFEGEQLTYRELNVKANQLAHYLQSLGIESEVLVGICISPSFEMIVGILGILKAGGAYVPLDSAYPTERLAFILEDSSVPVLLTQAHLAEKLPQHSARVVCLDAGWPEIACLSEENPKSEVTQGNLAYVIYTSGSTGKPKGVLLEHRGLCNLATAQIQLFQVQSDSRILQFASISFDASVWEIFVALVAGATLVLARRDVLMPGQSLSELLHKENITTILIPPSALAVMPLERLPALQTIIVGGEACPPNLVTHWAKERQFFNAYGPTEATVCATVALCSTSSQKLPIGRAIANTQVYVLDEKLQPVPIGVSGELYIGGNGLARGYLNRPDLTAEKFIPNPFSNEPGSRLYKTGDLACYLPDGNLEFLGRIDHQVKIRGYRIELGEIEAVLSQHPSVQLTVVLSREDVPNKKQLVAYVVPDRKYVEKIDHNLIPNIRSFLQKRLPNYMVPSAIVLLDALPLNPNGKVDRQALAALDTTRPNLGENFVTPRTPIEKVLAQVWSEVLELEQVGIHDKFLELGGHSLLAIQIISRLRDILNVELSLDSFLVASATIAEQAQRIEAGNLEKPFKQAPIIQATSRDQTLSLSWSQEHLWFLAQFEPDAPVYNEPFTIYFKSAINVEALSKALNEIIQRHESLRTNFITVNGQPVQAIAPSSTFNLTVIDLRKLPQEERETEALRLATIDAKKRFDLTNGLLLRATLIHLADTDSRLFLTCHHIVIDGFSVYNVFLKELETLYEAFSTSQPSSLTPLPIQYVDFAHWQRQSVTQEMLSTQLDYWKQQLADVPLLHLPCDHPRSAKQTFRGARLCLALSKDLTLELKALSQQLGVTLYMMLLAAFKTLLYRYTEQTDIVVGTVSAGRNQPQIEGLIGYFLNTLVLRTDLSGCPSFLELLERLKEVTLAAYAHEDLPFLQLVQTLQTERNPAQNPLFQVAFVLEPPASSLKSGWIVSQLDVQTDTAKFDLTLELEDRPEGVIGRFEYNTDLFETSTISRMAGHFQTLLAGIVANPQQPISKLPLLTQSEQHQLLVEWNNTQTEYPQDKCIHQLFEEQVELTPNAVAVVFEGKQLTYQELNAKANQLAHYLQTLGVGLEVLVGICVERSLEMVVGLLAILKAGSAYVPLDPTYPPERLAFMLEDTQVRVLLTQQQLIESLPLHQTSAICLDTAWKAIAQQSEENLASFITPDNLVYLIYTSGSTGKPKGIAMSHRSLSNLIKWQVENSTLSREARTLQFSPVSFDVSFQEIFSTWCAGGTLVLISDEVRRDSVQLWRFLTKEAIARIFLPFVALQQLAEVADTQETFPISLREIITAGEQLLISRQIANLFTKLNNCTLQNQYGPSESHVVTAFTLTDSPSDWPAFPPIGRPITNTQIYILDSHLKPVPIGVFDSLYIGGVALAQGYINQSNLTAEKFIPNPFSNKSGERLYKTGDKARYLPDGNIEFLGRTDEQVKIRGFRIELGEIEAALAQHPDVIQTVVVVREDIPNNKHLVAYVVSNLIPERLSYKSSQLELHDNSLQRTVTANLRDYLKQKLPDYMIPSAFVLIKELPLTPNGKVDRQALMALDNWGIELEDQNNFVAPTTPTEKILAAIWAEVLGLEQVGINDNFFELGGHSLLATQIISRIRSAFAIELPLRSLFEAPTIASLAQVIETVQQGLQEQSDSSTKLDTLPPLVSVARDTPIPLSFSQQTFWSLQQLYIDSCASNCPIALCFNGLLRKEELEKSINEIIRRHEILRTNFTVVNDQPIQVIAPSLTLRLNVIDLQHLPEQEREVEAIRLSNQEAQHHFNLTSGSLIKTTLLCLTPQKHWLLITMHHIITDGWSYSILLQELGTLYEAFSNGLRSPLPEVTIQYADFTLWQQKYLNEEALEKQRSYWFQKLENIPIKLDLLPSFQSKFNSKNKQVGSYSIILPYNQVDSIAALSHSQGVTIFAIILAALKILLYKLSGQTDTIILATSANRKTPEVEKMLGCFINDLFLRDKIDSSQTGFTFLKQVNQTIFEALANQDISEKSLKTISKIEFIRTINVSMTPPIRWDSRIIECEVASICLEHELWDEQSFPLELYIYSQDEDYTTIEIVGYYSRNCFTRKSIERLFSDYQEILKQIVQYPERFLSEFELTPDD